MNSDKAVFLKRLEKLQKAFLDSCDQRGALIEREYQLVLRARDATERIESLQRIRDEVHKLAGSSGTYGFATLGQAAFELERCCSTLLARDDGSVDASLGALTALINEVLLRIRQAQLISQVSTD